MNIPYLPTDSLYKFSAIVGTTLVVLSAYLPIKTVFNLSDQALDAYKRSKILVIESEYLKQRSEHLKEIVDNSLAMQKKGWKSDKTKLDIPYSTNELKQMIQEVDSAMRDMRIKQAELEVINTSIALLEGDQRKIKILSWFGVFIGMCIATYGFRNWYRRIQKYQDVLIAQTATKAEDKEA